jgi:NitT/TauT family transport system substrate-binding protein
MPAASGSPRAYQRKEKSMSFIKKSAFLAAVILLMSAAALAAADKPATVRLGVMAGENDSYIPAVGEELGIFEKYGLEVKYQEFSAGINTVDALILGQLDLGMAADFAILNRIGGSEKSDLRIYVKLSVSLPGTPYSWQFYTGDASVSAPADLAAKSITVRKGTVEEYWTARLLGVGKVSPDSVKILPIGSLQEGVAAVKSKQASGMWGGGQAAAELRKLEGVRPIADLSTVDAQTVTLFLSTNDYLENNKETVANYIRALDEIVAFIRSEPERTAEIVHKKTNVPAEQVLINLERSEIKLEFTQETIDTLDSINGWGREAGFIKQEYDVRDYVNVDALREVFPDRVNFK